MNRLRLFLWQLTLRWYYFGLKLDALVSMRWYFASWYRTFWLLAVRAPLLLSFKMRPSSDYFAYRIELDKLRFRWRETLSNSRRAPLDLAQRSPGS